MLGYKRYFVSVLTRSTKLSTGLFDEEGLDGGVC